MKLKFSSRLSNSIKCVSLFAICRICTYTWIEKDKKAILIRSSHDLVSDRKEKRNYTQQHWILPDISSVCSIYITYCIAKNSNEDAWYICWVCFLSYFKTFSKVHSLQISNISLQSINRFLYHTPSYYSRIEFYILYKIWKKLYAYWWHLIYTNWPEDCCSAAETCSQEPLSCST